MNTVQIGAERPTPPSPGVSAPAPPVPGPGATDPLERGRFAAWGRLVARRRRTVVAGFVLSILIAAGLGSQMFAALQSGGYDDPSSESAQAATALQDEFGLQQPFVVVAIDAVAGLDNATAAASAASVVRALEAEAGVDRAVSYWTSGRPDALRGTDGRTGQVLLYADPVTAQDVALQTETAHRLITDYDGPRGEGDAALSVHVGGGAAINDAITENITADLTRAESIAIPITMVLLLVVFGSLVSAGLPFIVALGSIVGSFAVIWAVTTVTDVSIFALNLITGLGLGLGIDYALLVVNRFREELAAGHDVESSVARTVASAGRTVVVSGATVAVVLGSLLFFPQYFLRSFGYAGIAVTLLAVVTTMTALPAVLAMVGSRVDRFRVGRRDLTPRDEGFWSRVARFVMRRPLPVVVTSVGLLAVLALPALSGNFSQADARVLPASDSVARASAIMAERFPGQEATPVEVVVRGGDSGPAAVTAYAKDLSRLDSVVRVVTASEVIVDGSVVGPNPQPTSFTIGADTRVSIVSDAPPRTTQGRQLVEAVRAVDAPGTAALVGGVAAEYADSQAAIADAGRWALVWVALATLLVMFLYTGSVVLPLKAVVLNVLSLGATLGVLVWIFQDGNLGWLVGDFTLTGSIDTSMAVLIAVVAFALSMDYEIFLLSRIKEEYEARGDNTEAVAFGLQRSGRIVTAAAMLIAVVFASFVSSGVTSIKQLGFGVAFAILLDATLV